MRKLLFLVLVAIAVCTAVEETEFDLDNFDLENLDAIDWQKIWDKLKFFTSQLKKWLKKIGIWDLVVDYLHNKLPDKLEAFCKSKKIPDGLCLTIINWIVNHIN